MSVYLQLVLDGKVPLSDVKDGLTRGTGLPPGSSCRGPASPSSPFSSADCSNLSPDEFRVSVLNFVTEEADIVFAAAEQLAAAHQLAVAFAHVSKPKPVPPPGAVTDAAFPALSGQPNKRDALDRRLSSRQLHLHSAAEVASTKRSSKKKIAPTRVQAAADGNPMFASASSAAADTAQPALFAEASARDLWRSAPRDVPPTESTIAAPALTTQCQPDNQTHACSTQASGEQDSHFVTPLKMRTAWAERSTPPSAGSSTTQATVRKESPGSINSKTPNAWQRPHTHSPPISHLSRHSAPAAMTPSAKGPKIRHISPVPVPRDEGQSPIGAPNAVPRATPPALGGSRLQPTSGANAWSRSPLVNPALEARFHSPSTAHSPALSTSNAANSSTPQQAAGHRLLQRTASNESPGRPAVPQSWATPPVHQRSRSGRSSRGSSLGTIPWQNESPGSSSQAQANTQFSSPGSTATSKPTWPHMGPQGAHVPITPPSQARSHADSTDTCFATPASTIRTMQDFSDDSPMPAASPSGSAIITPGSTCIGNGFAVVGESGLATDSLQAGPAAFVNAPCGEPPVQSAADSAQLGEAESGLQGQQAPEVPPSLVQEAQRLAELHAFFISGSAGVSLAAELDLVLHLLAVAPHLVCCKDPPLKALFPTGASASLYAGQVLLMSGRLVVSLGRGILESLVELPMVRLHMPALLTMLNHALQVCQGELPTGSTGWTGGASLFGAGAFTQDGQRQRSQEEQRRVSNMNDCRDGWTSLMRAAANPQPNSLQAPNAPPPHPQGNPHSASGDEATLAYMQQHTRRVLRGLRPDNFGPFSELFVAALLQAAATGESLLDSKLETLAKRDVAKFYRLNQRMQGQAAGHRPGHQARYTTSEGHRSGGSSPAFLSPSLAPQHSLGFGSGPPSTASSFQRLSASAGPRQLQSAALLEADLADVAAAQQVPPAQRLFLLFLQASDSHRLNSSLVRCMSSKLQEMHQQCLNERAGSEASRTQRLVAQCCLASFLSFLFFTASGPGTINSTTLEGNSGTSHFLPGIDLSAALLAAIQGNKLVWVVPWVTHYLRFLTHDSFAQSSASLQQLLQQLQSLHTAPLLLPSHPGFGPVQLCVRCVLDDHLERTQEIELDGFAPGASWAEALQEMQAMKGEPGRLSGDSRLLQLCCPALEGARQALQASVSANVGSWERKAGDTRAIRRIMPSQPPSSPRGRFKVPPQIAAAAKGAVQGDVQQHSIKLKLQQAFVEQYSTAEHKVKLREVVDYVMGIIAQNAACSGMQQNCDSLATAAAVTWRAQAEQASRQAVRELAGQAKAASVQKQAWDALAGSRDALIASSVHQAMQDSYAVAERYVERQAVRALAALAPPDWTPHVIGTAAALLAENAKQCCAQQIVQQVPIDVPKTLIKQLEQELQSVVKNSMSAARKAEALPNGQIHSNYSVDSPG